MGDVYYILINKLMSFIAISNYKDLFLPYEVKWWRITMKKDEHFHQESIFFIRLHLLQWIWMLVLERKTINPLPSVFWTSYFVKFCVISKRNTFGACWELLLVEKIKCVFKWTHYRAECDVRSEREKRLPVRGELAYGW